VGVDPAPVEAEDDQDGGEGAAGVIRVPACVDGERGEPVIFYSCGSCDTNFRENFLADISGDVVSCTSRVVVDPVERKAARRLEERLADEPSHARNAHSKWGMVRCRRESLLRESCFARIALNSSAAHAIVR
jgi:hypothetical protein